MNFLFFPAGEDFTVEVTNNGPAILGSTAHFIAKVRNGKDSEELEEKNGGLLAGSSYKYTWKGDVSPLPKSFLSNTACNFNLSLTDSAGAKPGELNITVTVCKAEFLSFCFGKIVNGYSKIEVTGLYYHSSAYRQLRARRALSLFNGTLLNSDNALLVLSQWYSCMYTLFVHVFVCIFFFLLKPKY